MKLMTVIASLLFVLPLGLTAKADHCANYQRVAAAAHELDYAAEHFHDVIHYLDGYSHLASDVHQLARAAAYFHDAVEYGADCNEIEAEFHEVSHEFDHVRMMLHRAHDQHHDPHVMHDWEDVEWAYRRVHRAVYRWQ